MLNARSFGFLPRQAIFTRSATGSDVQRPCPTLRESTLSARRGLSCFLAVKLLGPKLIAVELHLVYPYTDRVSKRQADI